MYKRRLLTLFALVLSLIIINISLAFAGPIMVIENDTHDFGTIEQGTQHKHIFKFKNEGNEDLEIIEVKPSCGCTAALLSAKVIAPGDTGEIEATFNSGKFKNKVKKNVSVVTNEPSRMVKQVAPGPGPRKRMEYDSETTVHKLYIEAFVNYDKEKAEALKRERERLLKESKKNKEGSKE